jgi:hypothetical protein
MSFEKTVFFEAMRGYCYCGKVVFELDFGDGDDANDRVEKSPGCHGVGGDKSKNNCLYCHCESCRRAHAAPVYQICYLRPGSGDPAFRLTAGHDVIRCFNKNTNQQETFTAAELNVHSCEGRKLEKTAHPKRWFCSICGSRVFNTLPAQPELGIGIFPALLEEDAQHNLPQSLRPTRHYLSHEAVLDPARIFKDDGLVRS